jgi:hypothetical protein
MPKRGRSFINALVGKPLQALPFSTLLVGLGELGANGLKNKIVHADILFLAIFIDPLDELCGHFDLYALFFIAILGQDVSHLTRPPYIDDQQPICLPCYSDTLIPWAEQPLTPPANDPKQIGAVCVWHAGPGEPKQKIRAHREKLRARLTT